MAAATLTLGDLATLHDTIQDKNSNELEESGKGTTDNILNGKGFDKVFSGRFDTIKIVMIAVFCL